MFNIYFEHITEQNHFFFLQKKKMSKNMIFEKVLIKMNQVPDLTDEERLKYAQELEFINQQVANLKEKLNVSQELTATIENVHNKCLSLHKSIDTFGDQYKRLESSISHFQSIMSEFNELGEETKTAWDRLHEVENKLKEKENPTKEKTNEQN